MRTSASRESGVRSAPRLVLRFGIGWSAYGRSASNPFPAPFRRTGLHTCANLARAWLKPTRLTPAGAQAVEGSDGLLLDIDGQIVPNYDATLVPFEEGDVVTGKVVRIDKDEVLVDIGYKSEGVIPANELSIRKSRESRRRGRAR